MRALLFLVAASLCAQDPKYLTALQEPSLSDLAQRDSQAEVYRFLWLRSFDAPIAVRLIVTATGGRLITKMTSGMGGFEPGHLVLNRSAPLSRLATEWFLKTVQEAGFWDLRSPARSPDERDGAEWVIEGVKQGRYHSADRWSPAPNDPVHILGIALAIHLARFRLLYQQVY